MLFSEFSIFFSIKMFSGTPQYASVHNKWSMLLLSVWERLPSCIQGIHLSYTHWPVGVSADSGKRVSRGLRALGNKLESAVMDSIESWNRAYTYTCRATRPQAKKIGISWLLHYWHWMTNVHGNMHKDMPLSIFMSFGQRINAISLFSKSAPIKNKMPLDFSQWGQ